MKRKSLAMLGVAVALTISLMVPAAAQESSATVYVPQSSIYRPEDAGKFAHTNYVVHTANGTKPAASPSPDFTLEETPSTLQCLLGLISSPTGSPYLSCNSVGLGTRHAVGGWGAIALVDAYDNPTAATDIATFASTYGLPTPNFTKIKDGAAYGYSGCTVPPPDQGWAGEEALDIEYSFAMAETAKIYLVEACSASLADLMHAELVAGQLVEAAGGGDISNSWGSGEFSGQTAYDSYFFNTCLPGDTACTTRGGYWDRIVYFASAGDSGCGAQWPSSSPWVVSAGGTTINRDPSTHNFTSESCWSGSGGGVSSVETWGAAFPTGMGPWVNFQYAQFGQTARQTPDISADADPASGVPVYCQYCFGGWEQIGGTSLASPLLAGAVNVAGNKLGQSPHGGHGQYTNEQNAFMYSELYTVSTKSAHFYDVSTGSNGCPVTSGWDQCTGIGSPIGYSGH